MANAKVRGITIELSADASGINKALQSVNKSINSTSKELKDIDKLLKLDPTNVTLLAQKQEVLGRQITNTKEKIDLLKKAEEDLKKSMVDGGTEEQKKQLAALDREIISSERNLTEYTEQMDRAGNETDQLADKQREAKQTTGEMSEGFTVLKGVLSNLVTDGIRFAADALKDMITEGPEYADEILTMAKTTSLATDTLQELSYMSGLVDVDVNTVAGSMKKLTKNMASAKDGSGTAAEAFKSLGVSVVDANGQLRKSEDVFFDAIDALGKIENEAERDATAMNIFGKSATELNPMIEAGSDQLRSYAKEARDMGYVLDDVALEKLGAVQDAFDRFDAKMVAVKNTVASGLAPAIERGMERIQDIVNKIDWEKVGKKIGDAMNKLIDAFEWIVDHGGAVKTVLAGILAALAVSKINAVVGAIQKMVTALKSAGSAITANPYVAFIAAMAAVVVVIGKANKSLYEHEKAEDRSWQKTEQLKSALEESTEAMKEQADACDEMVKTQEDSISSGKAQLDNVQSLANELRTLADENGNVAESDQARAQFILNELNGALGTEYQMVDGVIGQYDQLSGSIDDVIKKKQAMIILEAGEEAYRQAIVGQADAERVLADAEVQRMDTEAQLADITARKNELMSATGPQLAANAHEIGELAKQENELNNKLEEQTVAYQEAQNAVDEYAWNIQQYTDNATAAISEDYDAIQYKSYETAQAAGEASNQASQEVINNARSAQNGWLETLSQTVSETTGKQVEFRDAGNGMVQAYVDGQKMGEAMPINQVQGMAKQMMNHFTMLNQQMQASAYNLGTGVAEGIYAGSGAAFSAMRWMANNLLAEFNRSLQIKSPSRKMMKQAMFIPEGVALGIERSEDVALRAMTDFSNKLADRMNPVVSGYGAGASGSGSAAGSNVSNVNYTQNIYSPKAPSRIELYRQTRNLLAYSTTGR